MKIIFAGSPEFACAQLSYLNQNHELILALTTPDKVRGRGNKLSPTPVKKFCLENQIPCISPNTLKDPKIQQEIKDLNADFMIVSAYGMILPVEILNILPCINVHASLLPYHRGAAPIERAILNNDKFTGISLMKMTKGLDEGPIIIQEKIPILNTDNSQSLNLKLAQLGIQSLEKFFKNTNVLKNCKEQDHENSTYAQKIKSQEFKLDLEEELEIIERKIRAFYPNAFFELDGKRCKILKAQIQENQNQEKNIKIIRDSKEFVIAKENKILKILELQMEGKKALSIEQFLAGYRNQKPQIK